jgi:hypothetical protein
MDKQEDVADMLAESFEVPKQVFSPDNLDVAIGQMFNSTARSVLRIKHITEIAEKDGVEAALEYARTVPANETVTEDGTRIINSFQELSDSELAEVKKILKDIDKSPKM